MVKENKKTVKTFSSAATLKPDKSAYRQNLCAELIIKNAR
jgi:hypothetical protein